jgi:Predicted membrane protein
MPVIGDPLTLVAGILRVDLRLFLLLVTAGKAARYAALVMAV